MHFVTLISAQPARKWNPLQPTFRSSKGLLEAAQETFVRAFLGWQKLRKPESKAVVTVEATSSLPDHDYLKKK
jgi:hypothetical protein